MAINGDSTARQIFNVITKYFDENLPFAFTDEVNKHWMKLAPTDMHNFKEKIESGKTIRGFQNFSIGSLTKIIHYPSEIFNEPELIKRCNLTEKQQTLLGAGIYDGLKDIEKNKIKIMIIGEQIYHPLSLWSLCSNTRGQLC